jgi:ABC-2 type transport system permease protein
MNTTNPSVSTLDQAGAIIWAKLRMGAHQAASVRNESKLKVGVISISAIGLWLGAFVLFYQGFWYLMYIGNDRSGDFNFGDLLMGRMLSIFGLAVFMLLIFSNVLVAFSTMYRSKEVVYLLQAPISFENFFYARFFECVIFSSWSLAYLGSPLMLAYGIQTKASLLFYAATLFFYLPFILIPACIGVFIAMLLVRIFPRLNTATMIALGVAAVGVLGLYIFTIIRETRVEENQLLPAFLTATTRMQSPFLPSLWTSEGVLAAAQYNFPTAGYYFGLVLSTACFSVWVTGKFAAWLFYPGYAYLMGQDRQRIKLPGRGVLGRLETMLRFLPEPLRGLAIKDIKLFWRDPTQWSQFVIFFGIMAIYIANLRNSSGILRKTSGASGSPA